MESKRKPLIVWDPLSKTPHVQEPASLISRGSRGLHAREEEEFLEVHTLKVEESC